jgi:hypothetical protein
MSELTRFPQHSVEARLARDVLASIGERRNDLAWTFVAKLGGVRDLEDLRLLGVAELVRRRVPRASASIGARLVRAPALERASSSLLRPVGDQEIAFATRSGEATTSLTQRVPPLATQHNGAFATLFLTGVKRSDIERVDAAVLGAD